ARARVRVLAGKPERVDGAADGLRHLYRAFLGAALEQDAELVTAEPRKYVGRPDIRLHQLGDLAQQLIARGVAEGVVHYLELVEVEVEQRMRPALTVGFVQRCDEAVFELAAVYEPCQGIVR